MPLILIAGLQENIKNKGRERWRMIEIYDIHTYFSAKFISNFECSYLGKIDYLGEIIIM